MKHLVQALPVTLLSVLILVVACGTVPDSNRKQVNFLPASEEAALGVSEFDKLKKSMTISTNPKFNAELQRVGNRLSEVMPVPHAEWEFVVFEDASPNAFALPGGKVGVHTGLFQVSQNESGLAAVIGHEVAHVVARHSGERLSRGVITAGAVAAGTYVLKKKSDVDPRIAAAGLGGAGLLSTQAFSREQELEADRLGALYMARAGYDPRESVRLWERFAAYRDQAGQKQGFNLLSTHPLDSVRIAQLSEYMPRALEEYQPR